MKYRTYLHKETTQDSSQETTQDSSNDINNNINKKSFLYKLTDKSVIVNGWYKFCLGIIIMVLLCFSNMNYKMFNDNKNFYCAIIFSIIGYIIILSIITLWNNGLYNIIHIVLLIFILLLIIYSFIQQSQEYQNLFQDLTNELKSLSATHSTYHEKSNMLLFGNAYSCLTSLSTLFIITLLFYYNLSKFDKK